MGKLKILVILCLTVFNPAASSQVKIRLFSNQSPESVIFSITNGKYEVNTFNGETLTILKGEPVIISRFEGKLAVKTRNSESFIADSVLFSGQTGDDSFSLRVNGTSPLRQYYSGDLQCFPDLETLVLINRCDIEKYIAGVVKAEGGSGKSIEYFKSQAVIARTYMFKYIEKHITDGYNVCDNTHCQAFNGLSSDSVLNIAALETKGIVILDQDSSLIISVFHSNCGGETSSSEEVWLISQSYLNKVVDPYCISSRSAVWQKRISINEWIEFLMKSGYTGKTDDLTAFNFSQKSRLSDYIIGSFRLPLTTIRTELNLRSTFFSVVTEGEFIIINGRGYGHGVGLCQEGAMVMAAKGFDYRQIIDFYYSGVIISDIKNTVNLLQTSREFLPPTP